MGLAWTWWGVPGVLALVSAWVAAGVALRGQLGIDAHEGRKPRTLVESCGSPIPHRRLT